LSFCHGSAKERSRQSSQISNLRDEGLAFRYDLTAVSWLAGFPNSKFGDASTGG
jgi:hypothetical protein